MFFAIASNVQHSFSRFSSTSSSSSYLIYSFSRAQYICTSIVWLYLEHSVCVCVSVSVHIYQIDSLKGRPSININPSPSIVTLGSASVAVAARARARVETTPMPLYKSYISSATACHNRCHCIPNKCESYRIKPKTVNPNPQPNPETNQAESNRMEWNGVPLPRVSTMRLSC